jgi:hypothetical protein
MAKKSKAKTVKNSIKKKAKESDHDELLNNGPTEVTADQVVVTRGSGISSIAVIVGSKTYTYENDPNLSQFDQCFSKIRSNLKPPYPAMKFLTQNGYLI